MKCLLKGELGHLADCLILASLVDKVICFLIYGFGEKRDICTFKWITCTV